MTRLAIFILGLSLLTPCASYAVALPACAGNIEIQGEHLLRVEQNGVVVITDGRALVLEGIRLPTGSRENAPGIYVDRAFAMLDGYVKHGPLTITALRPKEDRYGRVRGQLFNGQGVWVQQALLRAGLARVAISPDRTECASELYAAEDAARAARAGIWADPSYAIRTPDTVATFAGTFQIVQGRVLTAELKNGRAYLDFGSDWHSDFTAVIAPEDMDNFRKLGVDPRSYAGQTIRVRGLVQMHNGPEIEVANPQSVQVIEVP
ncbi:MAG: thermonuclease family protein [Proteobacteria bacterium]|nr:thermonuclease family protein [Pseudomonadota bacterium]